MITDDQIEAELDKMRANIIPSAQARADRYHLEKFRESQKAMIMKEIAEVNFGMPIAAQERDALCHPKYLELLKGIRDAVFEDERLRNEDIVASKTIDAWQTMSANIRGMKI